MIETITFNNVAYPKFQSDGFAAKFAFTFANEVCKGIGFDVGFKNRRWQFPGSIGIDIDFYDGKWHALNFPTHYIKEYDSGIKDTMLIPVTPSDDAYYKNRIVEIKSIDYIFSSHCLEHVDDWVTTLNYWTEKLAKGGVLFLYLPHYSQDYWRPWNNRRHKHILTKEILTDYFKQKEYHKYFISDCDLNNSFMVMCEK